MRCLIAVLSLAALLLSMPLHAAQATAGNPTGRPVGTAVQNPRTYRHQRHRRNVGGPAIAQCGGPGAEPADRTNRRHHIDNRQRPVCACRTGCGRYVLEAVDATGQIVGTSSFIFAAPGTTVAATVTATSGAASAVNTVTGSAATLTTAAQSVKYAAVAAGVTAWSLPVAWQQPAHPAKLGDSPAIAEGLDVGRRRSQNRVPRSRVALGVAGARSNNNGADSRSQRGSDDRFGPLSLKSTIALTNIGIDTNVFNAASSDDPQSDFTMTFTPVTDLWLRMGRTWISGRIDVDWVYYQTVCVGAFGQCRLPDRSGPGHSIGWR